MSDERRPVIECAKEREYILCFKYVHALQLLTQKIVIKNYCQTYFHIQIVMKNPNNENPNKIFVRFTRERIFLKTETNIGAATYTLLKNMSQ